MTQFGPLFCSTARLCHPGIQIAHRTSPEERRTRPPAFWATGSRQGGRPGGTGDGTGDDDTIGSR